MSGAHPDEAEDMTVLAGEYVLGVLDPEERRAVERRAGEDPRLALAIAGWERRLAPMLSAVPDIAPPETLWDRIGQARAAADTPEAATAQVLRFARPAGKPRRVLPWQLATGLSMAIAAGLALLVVMPPGLGPTPGAPEGRQVALVAVMMQPDGATDGRGDASPQMASDSGIGHLVQTAPSATEPAHPAARMTGFLAASWTDGTVVLTPLAPMSAPRGRTLRLWLQSPGAATPVSLGTLPPDGRAVSLPALPADGTVLSVSMEAQDATAATPSGPILYSGALHTIRR